MGLAENPWPFVIVGVMLAIVMFFQAAKVGKLWMYGLSILFLFLAGGAYYVESIIVTPAEEIEASLDSLIDSCIAGDVEKAVSHLSNNALEVHATVRAGLAMIDIDPQLRVTDISTEMKANNTRGISHFRANGTVRLRQNQDYSGHAVTRWNMTWQKEGDQWKVIKIDRLNPMSGEPMKILEKSN